MCFQQSSLHKLTGGHLARDIVSRIELKLKTKLHVTSANTEKKI